MESLEASLPTAQSSASDSALLLAGNLRLITKEYDDAISIVERLLPGNGNLQTPIHNQAQVPGSEGVGG